MDVTNAAASRAAVQVVIVVAPAADACAGRGVDAQTTDAVASAAVDQITAAVWFQHRQLEQIIPEGHR